MTIRFYSTMEGRKVDFKPEEKTKVKIYSCGPTVYNFAHLGNFRSYVFTDTLRRFLKFVGYEVEHCMNITDVDDKTIKGSAAEGVSLDEFTQKYTKEFFIDLEKLNIEKVEHYPRATHSIEAMLDMVKRLDNKGFVYEKDKSLYFSINKFPNYGRLSKLDVSGIKAGSRYDADEYTKDDVRDFVLWKSPKDEKENRWPSEFGEGRPGWHLECSAMIHSVFKGGIDIHTGGIDLVFPHHENEIAQSVCAYDDSHFVKYWMHNEHLLVEGKKMSKTLGNFYTLRDLEKKGYSPRSIRYVLFASHYRSKLNFTLSGLDSASSTLKRIDKIIYSLLIRCERDSFSGQENDNYFSAKTEKFQETVKFSNLEKINSAKKEFNEKDIISPEDYNLQFALFLSDDLNTARSLALFFELIKVLEKRIKLEKTQQDFLSKEEAENFLSLFFFWNKIFGFLSFELSKDEKNMESSLSEDKINEIETKLQERTQAKKNKDWAKADKIRDDLKAEGIIIEDTPNGIKWKKI